MRLAVVIAACALVLMIAYLTLEISTFKKYESNVEGAWLTMPNVSKSYYEKALSTDDNKDMTSKPELSYSDNMTSAPNEVGQYVEKLQDGE